MDSIPFSLLCRLCSLTNTKSGDLVSMKMGSRNAISCMTKKFAHSSYQRRPPYWEAQRNSFAASRSRSVAAAKVGSLYQHSWLYGEADVTAHKGCSSSFVCIPALINFVLCSTEQQT